MLLTLVIFQKLNRKYICTKNKLFKNTNYKYQSFVSWFYIKNGMYALIIFCFWKSDINYILKIYLIKIDYFAHHIIICNSSEYYVMLIMFSQSLQDDLFESMSRPEIHSNLISNAQRNKHEIEK